AGACGSDAGDPRVGSTLRRPDVQHARTSGAGSGGRGERLHLRVPVVGSGAPGVRGKIARAGPAGAGDRGARGRRTTSARSRPDARRSQPALCAGGRTHRGRAGEAAMRTPPFLAGAGLLFWGWQTGFLPAAVIMAAVLEGSRWTRTRWDFSDDDFSRIWTFCTLLFLGAAVYAFTDNGGPARFGRLLQNSTFVTLNSAGTASARTASAILRWLPMVLFFFMAAQAYSTRPDVPLTTISLLLRRRLKRAVQRGGPAPVVRKLNMSYPFFAVCLFAASIHSSENNTYFLGLCPLLAWVLWPQRSRRFGLLVWCGTLVAALGLGYFGQHGIGQLQAY